MKLEVWVIKNNVASCHYFENRDKGNEFFKSHHAEPMITRNGEVIRYWNSVKTDWLLPMIYAEVEGYDWRTSVEFDVLYSVYDKRFIREKNGEDSFHVVIDGESFCVVGDLQREDWMLAALYGSKDKYMMYTFYDSDNNELSNFCIEV